ncbi:hypothetical protein [Robbsia andropogonis]|uniref:hypothetical protein n=1 Tax=Robbsia andropogonis TaxID=28092 RepID=UPI002A6A2E67|nr:hypothetical protein [Robbsia andropogonis]
MSEPAERPNLFSPIESPLPYPVSMVSVVQPHRRGRSGEKLISAVYKPQFFRANVVIGFYVFRDKGRGKKMGVEWLAGGAAVFGLAVVTLFHETWRNVRLKRTLSTVMSRKNEV